MEIFFYIYKFKSSQTHKKIKKRWISHIAMKRLVVRCERGIFFICIKILDFDIFNISAANSRLALSAFFIFIIFFYRALSYVSEQSRALEIAIGHSRIFYKIQKILKTHKIVAHYSKKLKWKKGRWMILWNREERILILSNTRV